MSDFIENGLMKKILEHLPVESLVRFQRVCRWMHQVINGDFIQERINLQKPRFITISNNRKVHVLDPHTRPMSRVLLARSRSEQANLVGTLHGIVCFYFYKRQFLLCNFLIRKSLIVPLPDFNEPDFKINRRQSRHVFSGFWIDSGAMEFKIVAFTLLFPDITYLTDAIMYSSKTKAWEPFVGWNKRMYPFLSESPPVVMEKVGYWRFFIESSIGTYIVSFDFEEKRFGLFKGPRPDYELRYHSVLSRWQNTLSLVFVNLDNRAEVYFWGGGETWIRTLRMDLSASSWITRVCSMVEYEGNDRDLAEENQEMQENRRILGAARTISFLKSDNLDQSFSVVYDYKASLLFPQELPSPEQHSDGES